MSLILSKTPEKLKEYSDRYYKKARDKILEQKKEYYQKNIDIIKEKNKRYYEINREVLLLEHHDRHIIMDEIICSRCNIQMLKKNYNRHLKSQMHLKKIKN